MGIKIFWSKSKKRQYDYDITEIGRLTCSNDYYNLTSWELEQLYKAAGTDNFIPKFQEIRRRYHEKQRERSINENLVLLYYTSGYISIEEYRNLVFGPTIADTTFPTKLVDEMFKKLKESEEDIYGDSE